MSSKLIKIGAASTPVRNDLTSPTAVRISGNGLRGFHRSSRTTKNAGTEWYADYSGQINAEDWSGSSWSRVSNIGGFTNIPGVVYNEGKNKFQISKNGAAVAWDFTYHSPNTLSYYGISVSRQNFNIGNFYAFRAADAAAPSYASGIKITTSANETSGDIYQPTNTRFSNTATLFIHYSGYGSPSAGQLIETESRPSLFFPVGGTYGGNFKGFEVSGDGNHIFVFIGGSLKLFSWNGSDWQFANDFLTAGSACSVNFDGSLVAIQSAGVKVYKNTGGTWAQLGGDLQNGTPWVNDSGTLVNAGSKLYEWDGSTWVYKWDTLGALSDDGTVAVAASGAGSIIRYELKDVAPIYYGAPLVSAIYAGAAESKAIYYGSSLLWNVAGWEPPAFSPASIPGLRLWLDASVGLYDAETGGNPVTTAAQVLRWEDQSGNGFHATATASTAPSLALSQVNSLPGILFPSSGGKYFNLPNPLNGASASVFVVVQPTQTGSDGGPLVGMIGSNNEYWSDSHYPYQNSNIEDGFAATTRKTITPLPSGMFTWHLYNVTSANSDWRYLFNGAVYYSTTSNTYNGASFTNRTPKIGYSDSRGTWFFRGTIAEIAIYNSALSEPDRQAVTEYLRAKYNLWNA